MTRFYDFLCQYYDLSFSRHNNLSNWIEPFLYFQKKDLWLERNYFFKV